MNERGRCHVVLLRGLTRGVGHWSAVIEAMRIRLPHMVVEGIDLPGNGRRYRERSPSMVLKIAEDVRAKFHEKDPHGDLRQRVHLVGLSLGGMVSVAWALAWPDEIATLSVANISIGGVNPLVDRMQPLTIPRICQAFLTRDAKSRERLILGLTSAHHAKDAHLLDRCEQLFRQHPVTKSNAVRQLVAAAAYRPQDTPKQPILLLSGGSDRLVAPRCSQAIAHAWHAEHRIHPDAGHDLPLDAPDWFVKNVSEWILRHSEQP